MSFVVSCQLLFVTTWVTRGRALAAKYPKYTIYGRHFQQSMYQPDSFVNLARGQLNRENDFSPVRVRA